MKQRFFEKYVTRHAAVVLVGLLVTGFAGFCQGAVRNSLATHDSSKWEKEIAGIEARDRKNPPPTNCILFVGSSSIRLWTNLTADFPGLPVVNHGFGGSQLADSVHFAERIIFPSRPRQVIIYAGTNDIDAGKDPELVYGDFVALVEKIRSRLPRAKIGYISIAPNPRRWGEVGQFKKANSLIAEYCRAHHLDFIDVFPLMLGPDGQPKPDIYVADKLHMNPKGYAIWKEAVGPVLVKTGG